MNNGSRIEFKSKRERQLGESIPFSLKRILQRGEGKIHIGLGDLGTTQFEKKLCREQGLVQLEKFFFGLVMGKLIFVRLLLLLSLKRGSVIFWLKVLAVFPVTALISRLGRKIWFFEVLKEEVL